MRKQEIFSSDRPRGRRIAGRAQSPVKHKGPTAEAGGQPSCLVCTSCSAVWRGGHWQWGGAPKDARGIICEACHRILENNPAGEVSLSGALVFLKGQEMIHLIRNEEEAEKAEHPMNRIISIDKTENGLLVKTTDTHLPHRIGEAVRRAYRGHTKIHYDEGGAFARVEVSWNSLL